MSTVNVGHEVLDRRIPTIIHLTQGPTQHSLVILYIGYTIQTQKVYVKKELRIKTLKINICTSQQQGDDILWPLIIS